MNRNLSPYSGTGCRGPISRRILLGVAIAPSPATLGTPDVIKDYDTFFLKYSELMDMNFAYSGEP